MAIISKKKYTPRVAMDVFIVFAPLARRGRTTAFSVTS